MTDQEPLSRPAALGLTGLSVAFGVIGMAVGFATLLGIAATANGGTDITGYGAMALTGAASFLLGLLLVAGGVLMYRAHRSARVVIGVAVTLLAVSSLVRMAVDSITLMSIVGSTFSLCALIGMTLLLMSDDVREHIRSGIPLQLR